MLSSVLVRFATIRSNGLTSSETRLGSAVQWSTAIGFGLAGAAFALYPVECCDALGMQLNADGIVEVGAFYGCMEIGLSCFSLFGTNAANALTLMGTLLASTGFGRLAYTSKTPNATNLHPMIAAAELSGAVLCLLGVLGERKSLGEKENLAKFLRSRQPKRPTKLCEFVPYCAANIRDPYPWYKALREQAPVLYKVPGQDYFIVTQYEHVVRLAKDTERFSSNLVAILLEGSSNSPTVFTKPDVNVGIVDVLALVDPPLHSKQRRVAFKGLAPKLFKTMETSIRKTVQGLLDDVPFGETFDWMDKVALRLPIVVALELCAFPTDEHRRVKEQADAGVALLSGVNTPEEFAANTLKSLSLFQYVQRIFGEMRVEFEANEAATSSSFTNGLLEAVRDGEITENEACSFCFQILLAGNDSTASTLGSSVQHLASNPELQEELRSHVDKLPHFIDEVLRYESPFGGHFRKVTTDCVYEGVSLKKGDRIMLSWAAGNRDPKVFPSPNDFNITRKNRSKHLAFGNGVHNCLGQQLAKLEVRVVLEEVFLRTSNVVVRDTNFTYVPSAFVRSLDELLVEFSA